MTKYEAIDYYEGQEESLGIFLTAKEARKAIVQRNRDTDGECCCRIVTLEDDSEE